MVVQHNISAMNANRYFGINNSGLSKSLEKLSSGFAINRAGDNAAGLAVSEKMRSQIAGLTQGVKNAEDGISMIQTYEGALTETDNILQRMKTLATQAANGIYQNEVDREAIQLEFNQLNDELDQIADTDFNGVVALNGGQMADGTKAVGGKFDYSNDVRGAKQLSSSDVTAFDGTKFATAGSTTAADQKNTNANLAWKNWSAGAGGWDRNATTPVNGPESFNVTFEYDGNGGWKAIKASDVGIDVAKVNASLSNTPDSIVNAAGGKNNGGFTLYSGTAFDAANEVANVVVDTTNLKSGDTIVLTFNNPLNQNYAPGNASLDVADNSAKAGTGKVDPNNAQVAPTVDVGTGTAAAGNYVTLGDTTAAKAMTKTAADSFNALQGANINIKYTDGKVSEFNIKLQDGSTCTLNTTAAATGSITTANGLTLSLSATADDGVTTIKDADGGVLFTITPTAGDGGAAADYKINSGSVSSTLNFETVTFKDNIASVAIADIADSSVSKSNAYGQASAPLTYADNLTLQTGARTKDAVNFSFKYASNGIGDLKANLNCSSRADGLGTKDLSLLNQKDANYAIDKIDNAINKVSMVRATFGATQNRLEHKIDNMNVTNENITAAESRIRDTDMAKEMTNFTKNQILSQASQAMLAQANQLPQGVLQLLG